MRQILVIGLGKFGSTVAKELTEKGAQVVAIDKDEERVEDIKELVAFAVSLDATDEKALRSLSVENVDVGVVCIGEDVEAALLTTLILKKIGVSRIWARAISPLQQEILRIMEVDHVVNLEEEMGSIVARSLLTIQITKRIPLTPMHSLAEVKIPAPFVGKSIRQLEVRQKYGITVVAIRRKEPKITDRGERTFEEAIEDVSSPDTMLQEDDVLIVVGKDENIEEFSQE
jgi:trk system potassium uptake protein TrkA